MRFVFWHHDVQGPVGLQDLWNGTTGFAASVARLRILFWLAARGHEVYLAGNVLDGRLKGVSAISGSSCLERWARQARDEDHTVIITLVPPDEEMWHRLPDTLKRRMIYWANNPFNPIWVERAACGSLLRVVCISQWHREVYRIYRGFDKVELGFHGIDLDLVAQAHPNRDASGSVLFCSAPRRTKGFHNMLRAWPFVREAVPDARLRVLGSARLHDPNVRVGRTGILDYDLEEEFPQFFSNPPESAKQFGIELLGTLGAPQVFSEMKAAAVAVVNCNWRGGLELSCSVAVQAQAAGTPVVGPARGGLTELIADGKTGLLVHKENLRALAQAIVKILRNPEIRQQMGTAGPAWVRPIADYELVVPQWEEIVARALAGQKAPHPRKWAKDTLRWLGYGQVRGWARNHIRGSRLERLLLRYVAG